MPGRVTLKAITDELAKRGHQALLAKAEGGYFYFWSGEAVDWLDRTVKVPTLGSLTLEQWMAEYDRLKKLNREIIGKPGGARAVVGRAAKRKTPR